jgi:hypothetical protein
MSRRSSFRSGDGVPSAASATRRDKKLVSHKQTQPRLWAINYALQGLWHRPLPITTPAQLVIPAGTAELRRGTHGGPIYVWFLERTRDEIVQGRNIP